MSVENDKVEIKSQLLYNVKNENLLIQIRGNLLILQFESIKERLDDSTPCATYSFCTGSNADGAKLLGVYAGD